MRTTKRTLAGFLAAVMTVMTAGTLTASADYSEFSISSGSWRGFISNGAGAVSDLDAEVRRTSDEAHSGKYSAYSSANFTMAGNTWIDIMYDIPQSVLKPNTTYNIKYWVKANNGGIHRLKTYYGGDGEHVDTGLAWYNTHDWTQQTKTFTTGDSVLSLLRLRFRSEGYETQWHGPVAAEMWIDDISVHEVVNGIESEVNLVADFDPGFEEPIPGDISGIDSFASENSVTLYWNENSQDAFDVNVYTKAADGTLTKVGTVASGTKTFTVTDLEANKAYTFAVASVKNGTEADAVEYKAFTNRAYNAFAPYNWSVHVGAGHPRGRAKVAEGYEGKAAVVETYFPSSNAYPPNGFTKIEAPVNFIAGHTYRISAKIKYTGVRFGMLYVGGTNAAAYTWEGNSSDGWVDFVVEHTPGSNTNVFSYHITASRDLEPGRLYVDNVVVEDLANPGVNLVTNGDMEDVRITPALYNGGVKADEKALTAGTYDMIANADLSSDTNTLTAVVFDKESGQVVNTFKKTFDVTIDDEYVLQNFTIEGDGEYGAFLYACTHSEDDCTCGGIEKEPAAISDITYTSAGNNVKLTWNKTATGTYNTNVYLKDGETLTKLGSTEGNEFEATELLAGKEYTFALTTTQTGLESEAVEYKAFTRGNINVFRDSDGWQFFASNHPYARFGITEGANGNALVIEAKSPYTGNAYPAHTFVNVQKTDVNLEAGHDYTIIFKWKNENVWNAQVSIEGTQQFGLIWDRTANGAGWQEAEVDFTASKNGALQFQVLTTAGQEVAKLYIDDVELYDNTVDAGVDLYADRNSGFDKYTTAPEIYAVNGDGSATITDELFAGTFRVVSPAVTNCGKNTLITAIYDVTNGGKLVDMFSEPFDVSGELSQTLTYDFTFTPADDTHVYEARAFMWNELGGLVPVTNVNSIVSVY